MNINLIEIFIKFYRHIYFSLQVLSESWLKKSNYDVKFDLTMSFLNLADGINGNWNVL